MSSTIHTLMLGTMDNFIHLITDSSGLTMVVDPAWDAEAIESYCMEHHLTLKGILLTHSHADHTSAVKPLSSKYNLPVYISREEYQIGFIQLNKPYWISDGDVIALGESRIRVIATPGHTLGSVCFYIDHYLISGDTLFVDGCGRCDFYESDIEKMWQSLQRLKTLPDETIIYSGHHYGQKTNDTLGNQKTTNPYLLIKDKQFFIDFRLHLQSQYRSIPFAPSSAEEMQRIYANHHS